MNALQCMQQHLSCACILCFDTVLMKHHKPNALQACVWSHTNLTFYLTIARGAVLHHDGVKKSAVRHVQVDPELINLHHQKVIAQHAQRPTPPQWEVVCWPRCPNLPLSNLSCQAATCKQFLTQGCLGCYTFYTGNQSNHFLSSSGMQTLVTASSAVHK